MKAVLRSLTTLFSPPFTALIIAVWAYFVFCTVGLPYSSIRHGMLPDSDDYMYLTQTLDWIIGLSWYDNNEYRLDPPGVHLHFFHLTQAPVAGLTLMFRHAIGMHWLAAALWAAGIWPLILLAIFLAAVWWAAAGVLPRDWSGLAAVLPIFMTPLLADMIPGHIHHHGQILLYVLLAYGCALRMMARPDQVRWGALAGFSLAFGLGIALEILPWLVLLSGWVVLWMMVVGRPAARSGLYFGSALFFGSAAMLMVLYHPPDWFMPNEVMFSVVYVYLTCSVAVACAGVALAAYMPFGWLRYFTGSILVLAGLSAFFATFPQLKGGPWGGVPRDISAILVDHTTEAMPLIGNANISMLVFFLIWPVLGLIASGILAYRARGKQLWQSALTTMLLVAAIGLTLFHQLRFGPFAEMFSLLPLATAIYRATPWMAQHWRGLRLRAVQVTLGVITIIFMALALNLFQFGLKSPDISKLINALDDPGFYGDHPRIILNTINEGAEVLFRTPHMVLAAPYHTDVEGIRDTTKFFLTHDPHVAEEIAKRHKADLILMNYSSFNHINEIVLPNGTRQQLPIDQSPFASQLAFGHVPDWLRPANVKLPDNYFLFEVMKKEPE